MNTLQFEEFQFIFLTSHHNFRGFRFVLQIGDHTQRQAHCKDTHPNQSTKEIIRKIIMIIR